MMPILQSETIFILYVDVYDRKNVNGLAADFRHLAGVPMQ